MSLLVLGALFITMAVYGGLLVYHDVSSFSELSGAML